MFPKFDLSKLDLPKLDLAKLDFSKLDLAKLDMGRVLGLLRDGRVGEALSQLQSKGTAAERTGTAEPQRPTGARAAAGSTSWGGAAAPDLAGSMQAFRDRLASGPLSGLGEGFGAPKPAAPPVPGGARFEERSFANASGTRSYKVFVPSGFAGQKLPVVVMLHGCTQDPDDFATGTRMNELAEEQTFLVAYPRQSPSANVQRCWNWFNVDDQRRDAGEPSLVAGIAQAVVEEFSADADRVYVAGLSAGGAAAAILAATYPDVFAAVGVHSGLACGAARDMPSAFAAMNGGGAVRPRGTGPLVPTIVFHGDGDKTVNPVNGDRVVAQASPEGALSSSVTRGSAPGGLSFTRTVQADEAGRACVEQWLIHGAGHAWSGGSAAGSYTEPRGPDASREMMRFFLAHPRGGMQ